MGGRIAITPRSLSAGGHPALRALTEAGYELVYPSPGQQPSFEQLVEILPRCVGYLAGVEPIGYELLSHCADLRVISRNGVGVDNIDLDAAASFGITVTTTPGANAQGVAELAIGLMLAVVRQIPRSHIAIQHGEWARVQGRELLGRTLGVIGLGNIGRRVSTMALGLGMRVVGHDPFEPADWDPSGEFRFVDLRIALRESDVISLHCPPGPAPLLDAAAIAETRRGVYVVNTARAELVDRSALEMALERGQVAGYATDVYEQEPPILDALLTRDTVITMPHAGGFTLESVERATTVAVTNLLASLEPNAT